MFLPSGFLSDLKLTKRGPVLEYLGVGKTLDTGGHDFAGAGGGWEVLNGVLLRWLNGVSGSNKGRGGLCSDVFMTTIH